MKLTALLCIHLCSSSTAKKGSSRDKFWRRQQQHLSKHTPSPTRAPTPVGPTGVGARVGAGVCLLRCCCCRRQNLSRLLPFLAVVLLQRWMHSSAVNFISGVEQLLLAIAGHRGAASFASVWPAKAAAAGPRPSHGDQFFLRRVLLIGRVSRYPYSGAYWWFLLALAALQKSTRTLAKLLWSYCLIRPLRPYALPARSIRASPRRLRTCVLRAAQAPARRIIYAARITQ